MSSPNQHFNDANGYESPMSHNNDYSNWNEDLVTSEIFSSSSSAISSPIMTNNECFAPLTSKILSSASSTLKPIQPTFTKNIIPDTKLTSNSSNNLTSSSQISFSSSSVVEEAKKKTTGGRKRKAESIEEKEQRQRERILRNRHAAQMSRDKKRKQMTDLESQNTVLKEENVHLSKRLKIVEEENSILSAKLDTILGQLAEIQSQLSVSEMNKVLLDGVRGSAVSAALETSDSFNNDDNNKEEVKKSNNDYNDYFNQYHQEINVSKKSLQRHVKFRNLYGTSSQIHLPFNQLQQQNCQILLFQLILKQALLTFSIAFWTMIGDQKNFLRQFINNNSLQMVFANDVIISEFIRCYLLNERQQRLKSSVKALRGCSASNLKHIPRDWRKYPP